MPARRPLDATAYGLMVVCALLWGLQQVTVKVGAAGVSVVMQGGIRSLLATLLLLVWAGARGIPLFGRDGTLAAGLAAGLLFAVEFFLIYFGLAHTLASRMVIFIYLAPVFTALGLAWWVPSERLARVQWLGVAIAFARHRRCLCRRDQRGRPRDAARRCCGVLAALLWAATTVLIRATRLASASAEKTLLYQLAISAALLPLASAGHRRAGHRAAGQRDGRDAALSGCHRGVRQLSRVVLAADALLRGAPGGVRLHHATGWRRVRRGSARGATVAAVRRRGAAGHARVSRWSTGAGRHGTPGER